MLSLRSRPIRRQRLGNGNQIFEHLMGLFNKVVANRAICAGQREAPVGSVTR